MKKTHQLLWVCSALLFCWVDNVYAQQAPGWTDYYGRKTMFPENEYIAGFSSEEYNKNTDIKDLLDRLETYAKTSLVESIRVTVKSISLLNISNLNANTHEEFRKSSVSYADLTITGLKTDRYQDAKKRIAYAVAYAKIADIRQDYLATLRKHQDIIERKIANAERFLKKNNKELVLKNYFETLPSFREIEQLQTVLVALDGAKLYQDSSFVRINTFKTKVQEAIVDLQKRQDLDINELSYLMAQGYKVQTGKLKNRVILSHFTYQDTEMASPFSKRLTAVLERKLIDVADYSVVLPYKNTAKDKVQYLLTGTYWEEGDNIRVISILKNKKEGNSLASMETLISKEILSEQKIAFKPPNYEDAINNLKTFTENDFSEKGLQIDLWTNKGQKNLIFFEGEILKLYVKVNRACYLRVVYYLADGSKVLLLDNYHLDGSKVNKVYEIPYEFECAEPFGVETLQLNAQAQPFDLLEIKRDYGYDFITEDTKEIVAKTRGFKRADNKEMYRAEKRTIITTMR